MLIANECMNPIESIKKTYEKFQKKHKGSKAYIVRFKNDVGEVMAVLGLGLSMTKTEVILFHNKFQALEVVNDYKNNTNWENVDYVEFKLEDFEKNPKYRALLRHIY